MVVKEQQLRHRKPAGGVILALLLGQMCHVPSPLKK
jgi:hypothetical protein